MKKKIIRKRLAAYFSDLGLDVVGEESRGEKKYYYFVTNMSQNGSLIIKSFCFAHIGAIELFTYNLRKVWFFVG